MYANNNIMTIGFFDLLRCDDNFDLYYKLQENYVRTNLKKKLQMFSNINFEDVLIKLKLMCALKFNTLACRRRGRN